MVPFSEAAVRELDLASALERRLANFARNGSFVGMKVLLYVQRASSKMLIVFSQPRWLVRISPAKVAPNCQDRNQDTDQLTAHASSQSVLPILPHPLRKTNRWR